MCQGSAWDQAFSFDGRAHDAFWDCCGPIASGSLSTESLRQCLCFRVDAFHVLGTVAHVALSLGGCQCHLGLVLSKSRRTTESAGRGGIGCSPVVGSGSLRFGYIRGAQLWIRDQLERGASRGVTGLLLLLGSLLQVGVCGSGSVSYAGRAESQERKREGKKCIRERDNTKKNCRR